MTSVVILSATLVICGAIWLAAWVVGKRIDRVANRLDRRFDGCFGRLDKSLDNLAAALDDLKQTIALLDAEVAAQPFNSHKKGKER